MSSDMDYEPTNAPVIIPKDKEQEMTDAAAQDVGKNAQQVNVNPQQQQTSQPAFQGQYPNGEKTTTTFISKSTPVAMGSGIATMGTSGGVTGHFGSTGTPAPAPQHLPPPGNVHSMHSVPSAPVAPTAPVGPKSHPGFEKLVNLLGWPEAGMAHYDQEILTGLCELLERKEERMQSLLPEDRKEKIDIVVSGEGQQIKPFKVLNDWTKMLLEHSFTSDYYVQIETSGHGFLCGLRALRIGLHTQHRIYLADNKVPLPTVEALYEIRFSREMILQYELQVQGFSSSGTKLVNEDNFWIHQLDYILKLWCNNRRLQPMAVAAILPDGTVSCPEIGDNRSEKMVWIMSDNKTGVSGEAINHYSGISDWQETKNIAALPTVGNVSAEYDNNQDYPDIDHYHELFKSDDEQSNSDDSDAEDDHDSDASESESANYFANNEDADEDDSYGLAHEDDDDHQREFLDIGSSVPKRAGSSAPAPAVDFSKFAPGVFEKLLGTTAQFPPTAMSNHAMGPQLSPFNGSKASSQPSKAFPYDRTPVNFKATDPGGFDSGDDSPAEEEEQEVEKPDSPAEEEEQEVEKPITIEDIMRRMERANARAKQSMEGAIYYDDTKPDKRHDSDMEDMLLGGAADDSESDEDDEANPPIDSEKAKNDNEALRKLSQLAIKKRQQDSEARETKSAGREEAFDDGAAPSSVIKSRADAGEKKNAFDRDGFFTKDVQSDLDSAIDPTLFSNEIDMTDAKRTPHTGMRRKKLNKESSSPSAHAPAVSTQRPLTQSATEIGDHSFRVDCPFRYKPVYDESTRGSIFGNINLSDFSAPPATTTQPGSVDEFGIPADGKDGKSLNERLRAFTKKGNPQQAEPRQLTTVDLTGTSISSSSNGPSASRTDPASLGQQSSSPRQSRPVPPLAGVPQQSAPLVQSLRRKRKSDDAILEEPSIRGTDAASNNEGGRAREQSPAPNLSSDPESRKTRQKVMENTTTEKNAEALSAPMPESIAMRSLGSNFTSAPNKSGLAYSLDSFATRPFILESDKDKVMPGFESTPTVGSTFTIKPKETKTDNSAKVALMIAAADEPRRQRTPALSTRKPQPPASQKIPARKKAANPLVAPKPRPRPPAKGKENPNKGGEKKDGDETEE